MIPVVGALNILPLFMTATMVWQQRLTPTAGDPQQQIMGRAHQYSSSYLEELAAQVESVLARIETQIR